MPLAQDHRVYRKALGQVKSSAQQDWDKFVSRLSSRVWLSPLVGSLEILLIILAKQRPWLGDRSRGGRSSLRSLYLLGILWSHRSSRHSRQLSSRWSSWCLRNVSSLMNCLKYPCLIKLSISFLRSWQSLILWPISLWYAQYILEFLLSFLPVILGANLPKFCCFITTNTCDRMALKRVSSWSEIGNFLLLILFRRFVRLGHSDSMRQSHHLNFDFLCLSSRIWEIATTSSFC